MNALDAQTTWQKEDKFNNTKIQRKRKEFMPYLL